MCRVVLEPTGPRDDRTVRAFNCVLENCKYESAVRVGTIQWALTLQGGSTLLYSVIPGQVFFRTGERCGVWFSVRYGIQRNQHLISLLSRTEELENESGIIALARSYGVQATATGTGSVQVSVNFNVRNTHDLRAIMSIIAEVPSDMRG